MGGLKARMPWTAWTMMIGVLAISGAPFLSGWYSKEMILSTVVGYVAVHPVHLLLLVLPFLTAAMTAYYMFRLWLLAFSGSARDPHLHHGAHEAPWVMVLPLFALAVMSVGIAWGWPIWEPHASELASVLHAGEPACMGFMFIAERIREHDLAIYAGIAAIGVSLLGAVCAFAAFGRKHPHALRVAGPRPAWHRFLFHQWYFDALYNAAFVRPTIDLARGVAAFDKRPTEILPNDPDPTPIRYGSFTLDGVLTAIARSAGVIGGVFRRMQTGRVRLYVAALALTAALMLGMLAVLAK
jgi:NADH-quinone oxidoreductase subunit L